MASLINNLFNLEKSGIDYSITMMFNKLELVGKLGHSPKDLHHPTL